MYIDEHLKLVLPAQKARRQHLRCCILNLALADPSTVGKNISAVGSVPLPALPQQCSIWILDQERATADTDQPLSVPNTWHVGRSTPYDIYGPCNYVRQKAPIS
jgi:hypothetical protein